jgi:hypothetical protein
VCTSSGVDASSSMNLHLKKMQHFYVPISAAVPSPSSPVAGGGVWGGEARGEPFSLSGISRVVKFQGR